MKFKLGDRVRLNKDIFNRCHAHHLGCDGSCKRKVGEVVAIDHTSYPCIYGVDFGIGNKNQPCFFSAKELESEWNIS